MKKILFLFVMICCIACNNGKSEYIQSANNVNSLIEDYCKAHGEVSTDIATIALEDFAEVESYRMQNQSKLLELEKKAANVIAAIDKLRATNNKCEKIDKLFDGMRHTIMESIYNARYEVNESLFVDREHTVAQETMKYIQQYGIELRSAVN